MNKAVYVVVPTLNASSYWNRFAPALLECIEPSRVLIVDSSSDDNTASLARQAGFQCIEIPRSEFNHGGTRQMAAEYLTGAEIIVYLTQDAILADCNAIANLVAAFDEPTVGVACGRQLPRRGAGAIEAHARFFNYPDKTETRDISARDRLGFKAVFISNSFSAYRRSALMAVGGFRTSVILSEDTIAAAQMLLAGWKIAYVANASVYHSHNYTWGQEFKRYFDIGVLHSREPWLLSRFGRANGEGKRFVISEARFLADRAPHLLPSAMIRTGLKLLAYRLGRMESMLTPQLKRHFSMHHGYWTKGA